ncbi:amidohydrolase [Saccharopolyspora sp. WRP15-2]|uniref:Amidohydrolase n=1 Tax=Saccharopolyspora oryzae TaxID=2997343 RepID=A0ABT4V0U3_9PSEU|nr:amidohydrolase [Saccharopolyspora oryzae]MDA3627560.1 amidohydrolase [Saccharopolyspora oryzae]
MHLDVLYINGDITTLDPDRPSARKMGVLGGVLVGLDDELDGCTAADVVDLGGAHVVPGFHDAHHHLSMRGQRLTQLDLRPSAVTSMDALYAAIREHAERLPEGAWVRGHGYDQNRIGGAHPTREVLDELTGGRPVWLAHNSAHMGVVNTAAIRLMGYADPRDLPDVPGGTVERDSAGVPTGLLTEQAQGLVYELIRPEPLEDYVRAIELGSEVALAEGLTSVTEPGIAGRLTGNGPADLHAFLTARERGVLGVRATVMPEMAALHDVDGGEPGSAGFGLDLGLRTGLGDDTLRIGAVKLFSDGSLIGRTASMCCDYADAVGNRGFTQDDPERLREQIFRAHRAGWQVATHAIGDAAVQLVLDAYARAQRQFPRADARHRIEHCGVTSDAQVAEIARLGVVPVPQGRFIDELGDGMIAALGAERAELAYRQLSFLRAGVEVPGSSDCPIVEGAPLLGIHALVNRETADGQVMGAAERLTPLQALRAFTSGSAYADHQEHRKGRLARGMLADFTVLSEDLTRVDPRAIKDVEVTATVVGGEIKHDRMGLTG